MEVSSVPLEPCNSRGCNPETLPSNKNTWLCQSRNRVDENNQTQAKNMYPLKSASKDEIGCMWKTSDRQKARQCWKQAREKNASHLPRHFIIRDRKSPLGALWVGCWTCLVMDEGGSHRAQVQDVGWCRPWKKVTIWELFSSNAKSDWLQIEYGRMTNYLLMNCVHLPDDGAEEISTYRRKRNNEKNLITASATLNK